MKTKIVISLKPVSKWYCFYFRIFKFTRIINIVISKEMFDEIGYVFNPIPYVF